MTTPLTDELMYYVVEFAPKDGTASLYPTFSTNTYYRVKPGWSYQILVTNNTDKEITVRQSPTQSYTTQTVLTVVPAKGIKLVTELPVGTGKTLFLALASTTAGATGSAALRFMPAPLATS